MLSDNVDIKDKTIIQNGKRYQRTEITEENIKHRSFVTLCLTLFGVKHPRLQDKSPQ